MKKLLSVLLLLSMLLTPVLGNADETWSTGRQGYQSEVKVYVTYNEAGERLFIRVDCSGETEGVGTQVMEPAFMAQFLGKSLPVTLGEDVDAVAGATVTSQAVVDALNLLYTQYGGTPDSRTIVNQRSVVSEEIYVLSEAGYSSSVKVTVKVNKDGVITSLKVDAEGEGNGAAVMEAGFRNQFIGRSLPVNLGSGVDAVSGATATSQAVVDALNRLAD